MQDDINTGVGQDNTTVTTNDKGSNVSNQQQDNVVITIIYTWQANTVSETQQVTRNNTITLLVVNIQGVSVVINFVTSWNGNQQSNSREVGTDINIQGVDVNMMNPDNKRQGRNTQQGDNDTVTTQDQDSSNISQDMTNNTEAWQDQDIDLRMTEEPE